jgi:hypothetical protein
MARKKPSYTGLQQARECAASELGLPVSDWRVERLAKLTVADEAMQSLLVVAPERVDFGKMLDVDRALADLRKDLGVTRPMELKVRIVHPNTKCPECGCEFNLDLPEDDDQAAAKPVQPVVPPTPKGTVDLVAGACSINDRGIIADHAKMHGPTVVPITAAERRKPMHFAPTRWLVTARCPRRHALCV